MEIIVIAVLLLINGIFAMAELALVSARQARLRQSARDGSAGAAAALELAAEPTRLLSTVQIGITLVGTLAGAFGGATIAERLAVPLSRVPIIGPYSEPVSLAIVVVLIAYFSLVVGELAPKRIAMLNPERIAIALAPSMRLLARLSSPLVRLLSGSTELLLRLIGAKASAEPPVTEDEIRDMMEQGTQAGVFEKPEQVLIDRVLRLGDLAVSGLMTPRRDIAWLDLDDDPDDIRRRIAESPYQQFPVSHGGPDNVLGIVGTQQLLSQSLAGKPIDLSCCLEPALFVPESASAYQLLERFKESGIHTAMVLDEYGGIEGLVTASDVLEAIVGALPEKGEVETPGMVQRPDGSWLVDGLLMIDELKQALSIRELPSEEAGHYQTLGGFVMMQLGRIPSAGDSFTWDAFEFEVVDMDGHRVDKVLVQRVEPDGTSSEPTG